MCPRFSFSLDNGFSSILRSNRSWGSYTNKNLVCLLVLDDTYKLCLYFDSAIIIIIIIIHLYYTVGIFSFSIFVSLFFYFHIFFLINGSPSPTDRVVVAGDCGRRHQRTGEPVVYYCTIIIIIIVIVVGVYRVGMRVSMSLLLLLCLMLSLEHIINPRCK